MTPYKLTSLAKLFLLLFVMVQGLVAMHAIDYGVDEHEHNGQLCEFYLHGEKNHFADIGGAIALELAAITYDTPQAITSENLASDKYSLRHARAPPVLS